MLAIPEFLHGRYFPVPGGGAPYRLSVADEEAADGEPVFSPDSPGGRFGGEPKNGPTCPETQLPERPAFVSNQLRAHRRPRACFEGQIVPSLALAFTSQIIVNTAVNRVWIGLAIAH